MFELMVTHEFCAAHFIPGYDGPCKDMHGHNYRVQLFVQGTELDRVGMLIDYRVLKHTLREATASFDHAVLNDKMTDSPTTEHVAKLIYERVSDQMPAHVDVAKVVVWESDRSYSSYWA